ncbi:Integral membrane protease of the rhomboid family involved in different forms of regulated intramembrane proteolysis [Ceraceosorus bombacis]|uniref:Integral membrane protease of the rhomboid family involved in different forms of regulated intramembrane proteolysis n=1 Tax=Ceraceosorus bombacis TaxID=401625 RepID=A0A0P1BA67_9BASI|nr:Integral membrane protease of the rhomboid family involved in different forms of regulated intramembrane proteolysis [Ceraceosorus bombacis]
MALRSIHPLRSHITAQCSSGISAQQLLARRASLPFARKFNSSTLLAQPRPRRFNSGLERHDEAEPLRSEDLLNPSGRIYSPRRGRDDEDSDVLQQAVRAGLDRDSIAELQDRLDRAKKPSIVWATLITMALGYSCYSTAAWYSVKDTEGLKEQDRGRGRFWPNLASLWPVGETQALTAEESRLRVVRQEEIVNKAQSSARSLSKLCDQLLFPQSLKQSLSQAWLSIVAHYLNLSPGQQAMVPVIAVNTAIFAASAAYSLRPLSRLGRLWSRTFIHSPSSGQHHTILTSSFAHSAPMHFLFNNLALWSFSATIFSSKPFLTSDEGILKHTSEASLAPHLLAFCALAGISSGLLSHLVNAARWRFLAARAGEAVARSKYGLTASLGSSGFAYSLLVMNALAFPDAQVGLIFLPMISFPIAQGVLGLVALDVVGVLRGWRMFDHWAHLGGAAFGYLYFKHGNDLWERKKADWRKNWSFTMEYHSDLDAERERKV